MGNPLVCVLITTYNHESFIEDALRSVLIQDYEPIKIVISDDASTDQTQSIILSYAEKYPDKIVPLLNEHNLGISANHAQGLRHCEGKYVVILDGDDMLLPGKIKAQVEVMEANPNLGMVYHDVEVFDSATDKVLFYWSERIGTRVGDVRTLVRYGMFTALLSVMFRRDWLPAYGYDERLRYIGDWYLAIETLAKGNGRIGYIDRVLARYRRHDTNVTSQWQAKVVDMFLTLALVESRWPHLVREVRLRRAEIYSMMAVRQALGRKWLRAVRLLCEGMRLSLPNPFPWWRLGWREVRYWVRHRQNDYMIKTILSKEN